MMEGERSMEQQKLEVMQNTSKGTRNHSSVAYDFVTLEYHATPAGEKARPHSHTGRMELTRTRSTTFSLSFFPFLLEPDISPPRPKRDSLHARLLPGIHVPPSSPPPPAHSP